MRIYRGTSLSPDKVDLHSVAAPFWPSLRRDPEALFTALRNYTPHAFGREAVTVDEDLLRACEAAISLGESFPRDPPGDLRSIAQALLTDAPCFRSLMDTVEKALTAEVARHPFEVDPTLRILSELLELSSHEEAFLRLAAAVELSPIDSAAFACVSGPRCLMQGEGAALCIRDEHTVRHMLRRNGPLGRSGLRANTRDGDLQDRPALSKRAWHLLVSRAYGLSEMTDLVLEKLLDPTEAGLEWPHLKDATALLTSLIGNAVRTEATGINLLVYGPPGTGKTQYVQQLVQSAGAIGLSVADSDPDGDAATREERLSSLMLTQLFATKGRSVIVLDEAEDVFKTDYVDPLARAMGQQEESKAWMNSLLESNRHPVVWISNRVEHLDPAYLRRFAYCLEVPRPPRAVREQIARRWPRRGSACASRRASAAGT